MPKEIPFSHRRETFTVRKSPLVTTVNVEKCLLFVEWEERGGSVLFLRSFIAKRPKTKVVLLYGAVEFPQNKTNNAFTISPIDMPVDPK